MGQIQHHRPALTILALFSRYPAALEWGGKSATEAWGPTALVSDLFDFTETAFYEKSMGPGLKKMFLAFEHLQDPAELIAWKHQTNQWEEAYAASAGHLEPRPLNLDPGYLTEAKLVLASTKDRDHRLYLGRGIYAEGTIFFHHGQWENRPWTYPDYQRADYHQFFTRCREYLRTRYKSA